MARINTFMLQKSGLIIAVTMRAGFGLGLIYLLVNELERMESRAARIAAICLGLVFCVLTIIANVVLQTPKLHEKYVGRTHFRTIMYCSYALIALLIFLCVRN